MRSRTSSNDSLVSPAQVWGGLATEARAGAIQLMAHLASNLVFQGFDSTHMESPPCLQEPVTPRSAPRTSTATP